MDSSTKAPKETVDFFLGSLSEIDDVVKKKNEAMQSFQRDLHSWLSEKFPGDGLVYKYETWHGFPAFRFFFEVMFGNSSVVLFLDGRPDKFYRIQYFICQIKTDTQRDLADSKMRFQQGDDCWDERNKTIRGYSRALPDHEIGTIREMLREVLGRLASFEKDVRPSWS